MVAGFSPRKAALTLYLNCALQQQGALLEGLGLYKTGQGCLYLRRLSDADPAALRKLIEESVALVRASDCRNRTSES